jgi:hypothetical protein
MRVKFIYISARFIPVQIIGGHKARRYNNLQKNKSNVRAGFIPPEITGGYKILPLHFVNT